MSNKSIQAILVNEYGGPNVLKIETVERPQPQTDEVFVRIVYATIIPLDYKIRNGWLQEVFPVTFPYIPGFYASGVVEEIGEGVTDFKPGDRIFGSIRGAYSEYGNLAKPFSYMLQRAALDSLPFSCQMEGSDRNRYGINL
ncbi:alcohol dehydrogenase catalytic domain-containing protein [Paenibacillus sp. MCAF20]